MVELNTKSMSKKPFKETKVGKPYVEGAKVKMQLVKNYKGAKIDVFKYKAKKRYQRSMGHRTMLSQFKVESITSK